MQRLVSPELKVYTISGREALSELVAELRLHKTLAGNLRQLLGFQTVGTGHQARQMAGDWQLLESVRWLKHLQSGKLVPVVGNNAIHIFKCCRPDTRVETRADMDFEKMPMRGGCSSAMARSCKWAPHPNTPAAAGQLLDGACLRNFAVARGAAAAHACAQ